MTSNEMILFEIEARDRASAVFESVASKVEGFGKSFDTLRTALGASGQNMEAAQAKVAALGRAHAAAKDAVQAAQAEIVVSSAKVDAAQKAVADAAKLSGAEQEKAAAEAAAALKAAMGEEEASLAHLQTALDAASKKHDELSKAQSEAGAKSKAMTGVLTGVGVAAGALGVGVGLAALDSVKAASSFQESMTSLVTGAGESKSNIAQVSDGILQLARDTGASSGDLAKGMYLIESAGYHGAQGLDVLKASAEGAKVGGADMQVVADAVTSGLNSYGLKASDAASMTNQLVATVASGKMHMQDLAGSLSAVLPVAAAAGIGFDQVGGAVATMTGMGMSAQQATQDLANTIRSLQSPNAVAVGEMEQLGLNATQVSKDLGKQGLTGTMAELAQAVASHMGPAGLVVQEAFNKSQNAAADAKTMFDKMPASVQAVAKGFVDGSITQKDWMADLKQMSPANANLAKEFAAVSNKADGFNALLKSGNPAAQTFAAAMGKMLGGATGLNVGLMLTGKNAATFQSNVKAVGDAAKGAGGDVNGWAEVQDDFNTKLEKAKQAFDTVKISIGQALLPVLSTLMDKVSAFIGPIADWISHNQQLAAAILIGAGAIGVLVAAVAGLTIAFTFLAANPIVLIITGIIIAVAALAAGIYMLVTHWQQVWGAIVNFTKPAVNAIVGVWQGFVGWFMSIWNPLVGWFISVWNGIVAGVKVAIDGFVKAWNAVVTFLNPIWDGIVTVIKVAVAVIYTVLVTPIVLAVHLLAAIFQWLWKNVLAPVWSGIVDVAKVAWAFLLANVINPIIAYVKLVASVYVWLWQNVLVPVWNGIQDVMRTVWNWILQNVINPIIRYVKQVADTFTWFWQNVIVPVWQGIQNAISTAWNWIVSNVMNFIHMEIKGLGIEWNWLHDNVIKPVWDAIQTAISTVWNWLSTNVFDPIGKAVDLMGKGFQSARDIIAKAWGEIQDAAKAPVKFLVDTVYTNGIAAVWDSVAKVVGLQPLPTLNFATGGTVPGYSPGNDTVHAMLSPGEGVLIPQAVRALGGAAGIDAINRMYGAGAGNKPGHFANGGVLDSIGSFLGGVGNAVGGALNALKNVALGGLKDAATPIVHTFEGWADSGLGTTGFGGMLDTGVHKVGDGFLSFLGGKDSSAPKGGGAVGSPGAVSGDLAQWVQQAMAAAGVAGANWLNGLETIAMHESGGNPNATNNWDSNAAAGDPSRGLMQTIGSTFEAYRSQALPDNIFDPVANIVAGIGYIRSRYGDISSVPGLVSMAQGGPYVGYDSGGWLEPGITHVYNGTGRREAVISPSGAGPAGSALGGGGVTVNINIENSYGTPDDRFIRQIEDAFSRRFTQWTLPSAGVQIRR